MEELFKSSVIKGLVYSAFDKLGPQPIYAFPREISDEESQILREKGIIKFSRQDYTRISIKSLSMIMGDQDFKDFKEDFLNLPYFGILPYPDLNLTSLTFYHFIKTNFSENLIISSFSILVEENQRSFLYNNLVKLKSLIKGFFYKFDKEIENGYKEKYKIESLFLEFLLKLIEIEKKPFATITSKRKMKILFAGLDDSGKTSFLLTIDRKYSKLIGLKPTLGAEMKSIEALGSRIFLWDLGGQSSSREKYLEKSQIYLYETDLLFYFIDIKNKERFNESIKYFQDIRKELIEFKQNPPIIFIFSKGDSDVLNTKEITENIEFLKNKLNKISPKDEPEIFITSIFSIFSILRAFSSGISKLSPNKELIDLNLKNFSKRTGIYLSLLLNNEGLVLADYYSPKSLKMTDIPKSEGLSGDNLRNIFETTAPQFAMLYKIFSKFKALQEEEAIFKIAKSTILIRRVVIADFQMFILFLMDEEKKKIQINKFLPDFLYRTSDLLIRYIS